MYLFPSIIVSTFTYILYPSPWNGNIIISCEQKWFITKASKQLAKPGHLYSSTMCLKHGLKFLCIFSSQEWLRLLLHFSKASVATTI